MTEDQIDYSKLNEESRKWTKDIVNSLLREQYILGIDENGYLEASTKGSIRTSFGIVDRISFRFLRYGVFVEKGVGKGYPIESVKSNGAIAKSGGKGRVPKPWFNPVIEREIDRLRDILQSDLVDIAVSRIFIK